MTTSNSPSVRFATESDIEALSVLFDGYRVFYRQQSNIAAAREFLGDRFRLGESRVIVAEQAGRLVGFTQLYPSFSSVSMMRLWILNDLFVDPASRKSGVGQALLAAARDFAAAEGAKGLILATETNNEAAQSLYQKNGYIRDTSFFHYSLYF